MGQLPGFGWRISGCIGQVYSAVPAAPDEEAQLHDAGVPYSWAGSNSW